MENSPILAVVVPCYKEEAVLHETHKRLSQLFDRLIQARQISPESYILYVNDGRATAKATNTPTISQATSPSRSSCPRAFRARSSTNLTRRTPPRPKSPNGWRSCGKRSTNETHRHYIRHPRNLRRHAPRISERRGRNLACGRHRLDRAGRPDRRLL